MLENGSSKGIYDKLCLKKGATQMEIQAPLASASTHDQSPRSAQGLARLVLNINLGRVALQKKQQHDRVVSILDPEIRSMHGNKVAEALLALSESGIAVTNQDEILFGRPGNHFLPEVILILDLPTVKALESVVLAERTRNGDMIFAGCARSATNSDGRYQALRFWIKK